MIIETFILLTTYIYINLADHGYIHLSITGLHQFGYQCNLIYHICIKLANHTFDWQRIIQFDHGHINLTTGTSIWPRIHKFVHGCINLTTGISIWTWVHQFDHWHINWTTDISIWPRTYQFDHGHINLTTDTSIWPRMLSKISTLLSAIIRLAPSYFAGRRKQIVKRCWRKLMECQRAPQQAVKVTIGRSCSVKNSMLLLLHFELAHHFNP